VSDADYDINSVSQWVDSGPPEAFPEGALPFQFVIVSGWIAGDSRMASADISTFNTPPVADAGNDFSLTENISFWIPCFQPTPCHTSSEAEERSYDPDGDPIPFIWFLFYPEIGWDPLPGYPESSIVPVDLGNRTELRLKLRAFEGMTKGGDV
jgi:hypothetical protein